MSFRAQFEKSNFGVLFIMSFDDLPNEVLQKVFTYLPMNEVMTTCSAVNKRWKTIVTLIRPSSMIVVLGYADDELQCDRRRLYLSVMPVKRPLFRQLRKLVVKIH